MYLGVASCAALLACAAATRVCNVVTDCGAIADNSTNAAPFITACVKLCGPNSILVFPANTSILSGSIDLSNSTNITLRFEAGAGLYGSGDVAVYPLQLALPYQGTNVTQWQALVYGRNVSGLTITGPASARIDGCGWPWWANFSAGTLAYQRPKLVEIVDSRDLTFSGMVFANSAFWTMHPIFSSNVAFQGITVLAPRAVGNTDGIDPDSCLNVTIDSCFVDVGDDGISVKSGFHDRTLQLMPTANVLITNTTVLSRNVAIGSACFGGIFNVSMVGGRIGDDAGSSPWAVKFKTHVPSGGVVSNISFSGVALGKIAPNTWQQAHGGTALYITLSQYGVDGEEEVARNSGLVTGIGIVRHGMPVPSPTQFTGISFTDIHVTSAVTAGAFSSQEGFNVSDLTLRNVTFGAVTGPGNAWHCNGSFPSTHAQGVQPPLPAACSKVVPWT